MLQVRDGPVERLQWAWLAPEISSLSWQGCQVRRTIANLSLISFRKTCIDQLVLDYILTRMCDEQFTEMFSDFLNCSWIWKVLPDFRKCSSFKTCSWISKIFVNLKIFTFFNYFEKCFHISKTVCEFQIIFRKKI